jgi:hypothetical protein
MFVYELVSIFLFWHFIQAVVKMAYIPLFSLSTLKFSIELNISQQRAGYYLVYITLMVSELN